LDDGRSLFNLFHHEWTLLVLGADPPPFTQFKKTARDLNLDLLVVRVEPEYIRELYDARDWPTICLLGSKKNLAMDSLNLID
jgi:hypothetical protein